MNNVLVDMYIHFLIYNMQVQKCNGELHFRIFRFTESWNPWFTSYIHFVDEKKFLNKYVINISL